MQIELPRKPGRGSYIRRSPSETSAVTTSGRLSVTILPGSRFTVSLNFPVQTDADAALLDGVELQLLDPGNWLHVTLSDLGINAGISKGSLNAAAAAMSNEVSLPGLTGVVPGTYLTWGGQLIQTAGYDGITMKFWPPLFSAKTTADAVVTGPAVSIQLIRANSAALGGSLVPSGLGQAYNEGRIWRLAQRLV